VVIAGRLAGLSTPTDTGRCLSASDVLELVPSACPLLGWPDGVDYAIGCRHFSRWRLSPELRKTDGRRPGQGSKLLFAGLQEGGWGVDDDGNDARCHLGDDRLEGGGYLLHGRDGRVWE
jgi:hypothetical protein